MPLQVPKWKITDTARAMEPFIMAQAAEVSGGGGNFPQFVTPMYGWNFTDSVQIPLTSSGRTSFEIELPADKTATGLGSLITPVGYTGIVTVSTVVLLITNIQAKFRTNIVNKWQVQPGGSGEWPVDSTSGLSSDEEVDTSGASNNTLYAVASRQLTVTEQVFLFFQGTRLGLDAFDTWNQSIKLHGWLIEYG